MPSLGDIEDFAALAPRITGSISAVSSAMIIFLICRSPTKLSKIYHRIMFGMSIADIMTSSAMALTTLPMPKNDDPVWSDKYDNDIKWEGQTKLGNMRTCEAQGVIFTSGLQTMFAYNGMLCIYYTCAIAFRMQEKGIRNKVEPFLHGVPLLLGLGPVIPCLLFAFYNPIDEMPFCVFIPLSNNKLGSGLFASIFRFLPLISISVFLIIILVSFSLIIWRVRKKEKCIPVAGADNQGDNIQIENLTKAAHKNTKMISVQSAAYIGAFLLTLVFPLIRNITSQRLTPKLLGFYALMGKCMLIFSPMQGFFNFVIFLWHKVENHRRGDSSISIFNSIRHQFNGCATETVLVSRLSMLQMHENELETAVNMEHEAADARMEAYDDLESLPSVTSRGRNRNLMLDNSEYGDDEDIEATQMYRHCVRMPGIQDPRVIQSSSRTQAAAWPTNEEELSFDMTLGSASPDHRSVSITRNDDFEEDKDVSMSLSTGADPSQTSKSIFSVSSWLVSNASQSDLSNSTNDRDNNSMSLGGLSGF